MVNWRQEVVIKKYNGDIARFEADFVEDVQIGRRHAVGWDDLLLDATTLVELKEEARELIERYLGYLPVDNTILPFEPYLRALIQRYRQHQLSQADYSYQIEEHIKLIRNQDMEFTYNTVVTNDQTIYHNYAETFMPFGQIAKSRLMTFLGYEPNLAHSIVAQMWMRHMIASDTMHLPETMTAIDQKAITMIQYREILLEKGRAAADASSLRELDEAPSL